MTIPPRGYPPLKQLPADFEGGTMKRLRASLPLQWWHVPNLVTEVRFIGALLLPLLADLAARNPIPEDQLRTFFAHGGVAGIFNDPGAFLLYAGCLLAIAFIVIALTDKLDGFLAKKIFGTSDLGAALDPLVDKILMLVSILLALVLSWVWGDWLVFGVLLMIFIFLFLFREPDVLRLKKAEAEARIDNKITSARQSGRMSMVVFCVAMFVALLPIVGPWSSGIKTILLLTIPVFSGRSWMDYRRAYGKYLVKKS